MSLLKRKGNYQFRTKATGVQYMLIKSTNEVLITLRTKRQAKEGDRIIFFYKPRIKKGGCALQYKSNYIREERLISALCDITKSDTKAGYKTFLILIKKI